MNPVILFNLSLFYTKENRKTLLETIASHRFNSIHFLSRY